MDGIPRIESSLSVTVEFAHWNFPGLPMNFPEPAMNFPEPAMNLPELVMNFPELSWSSAQVAKVADLLHLHRGYCELYVD